MNEADTRRELIDPKIKDAGWGEVEGSFIRAEFQITNGEIKPGGIRAGIIKADYVLIYKNRKLAVIEAKKDELPVSDGVGQAKDYAQKLKEDGLAGVFVCGTTGEGMSMTLDERKRIAEEWVKYQNDEFKIIVHVGTTSVKQSQELAQHTQQIGAYGSSSMGPMFLKPTTVEPLVDFCSAVASAAPDIPFFYYHIPLISGVDLSMRYYLTNPK